MTNEVFERNEDVERAGLQPRVNVIEYADEWDPENTRAVPYVLYGSTHKPHYERPYLGFLFL